MKYVCTLIAVKDIEKSKVFYHDVMGLEVVADSGANVTLTGNIALQSLDTWKKFIHKQDEDIVHGNNACELYFEEDDIERFAKKIGAIKNIEYIHPLFEHSWGQRVIRFYDPDRHIIEVGENLKIVVKRFIDTGLSIEETAGRMDIPVDFAKSLAEKNDYQIP